MRLDGKMFRQRSTHILSFSSPIIGGHYSAQLNLDLFILPQTMQELITPAITEHICIYSSVRSSSVDRRSELDASFHIFLESTMTTYSGKIFVTVLISPRRSPIFMTRITSRSIKPVRLLASVKLTTGMKYRKDYALSGV